MVYIKGCMQAQHQVVDERERLISELAEASAKIEVLEECLDDMYKDIDEYIITTNREI